MHELQVKQGRRRRGHATRRVLSIDSQLPPGGWIEAHVHEDNEGAQAFYRALKFESHSRSAGTILMRRRKAAQYAEMAATPRRHRHS